MPEPTPFPAPRVFEAWLDLVAASDGDRPALLERFLASDGGPIPPPTDGESLPPGALYEERAIAADIHQDYSSEVWWVRTRLENDGYWHADVWLQREIAGEESFEDDYPGWQVGQTEEDLAFYAGRGDEGIPPLEPPDSARGTTRREIDSAVEDSGAAVEETPALLSSPTPREERLLALVDRVQNAVFGREEETLSYRAVPDYEERVRRRLAGLPAGLLDRLAAWATLRPPDDPDPL